MADEMKKNIDNEELDLKQLENVNGGNGKERDFNYNDIKEKLDRIANKLKSTNNH